MKLIESILTQNDCYKSGRTIAVKGLMIHSVGCNQPKASVFINSWNRSGVQKCVHGFIDGNDGVVYQTLPWNHRGWHCASGKNGSGNNTHIGVEMCEPACIKYTGGSSFTCSDLATARAVAKRTYEAAVELFAMLCVKYGLDPLADGVVISHKEGHSRGIASNHGDPEHLWKGLQMGYTMDTFRKAIKEKMEGGSAATPAPKPEITQATSFANLTEEQVIVKVGPLFTADQQKSGVLASVSLAQFILESGYGKSELAQNANNCFGMKRSLSGNSWSGSAWDGTSIYTKQTKEQNADGSYVTITADFRKYSCVEDSIADHSAYLLGAKNGNKLRYEGLKGCADYRKAAQIIKDGGYATSLTYVDKLCSIIERWKLTQYDAKESSGDAGNAVPEELTTGYYRVRKTWADSKSQLGAYRVLSNAKAKADENPGYTVFDNAGNAVYAGKNTAGGAAGNAVGNTAPNTTVGKTPVPYKVRVSIPDLNIRKGPGTDKAKTGKFTGVGVFTIVAEAEGAGSKSGWGLLKAYADKKNGWISLDYTEKI